MSFTYQCIAEAVEIFEIFESSLQLRNSNPVRKYRIMPSQNTYSPPWYKRLNIDLFLVSTNELGACAFFAWILPLMVLARGASFSDRLFAITTYGAIAISLLWILSVLNVRLAYGPPRDVQLSEEVVIITGGASGLGLLLAETFGMRGASVAVLDIKGEQSEAKGVTFYKCDVSERHEIESVAERINDEVSTSLHSCSKSESPKWNNQGDKLHQSLEIRQF